MSVLWALGTLASLAAAPPVPDSFRALPDEVRAQATVVVSGRFRTGRGPCEPLPDGRRRWGLLQGFEVETVYVGALRSDYVGVRKAALYGSTSAAALIEGHEYLVLLRPSERSRALLDTPRASRAYRDALPEEEVLAIVER